MKTVNRSRFDHDLANAAIRLFERGNRTPRVTQIAREHYKKVSFSRAGVADVQRRLRNIKKILDEAFELDVVLVGPDAFVIVDAGGPVTEADAWRCLPVGRGRHAQGLHLCTPPADLIYQAAIHLGLIQAAGRERANIDRAVRAHEHGNVAREYVYGLVSEAAERRVPVRASALDAIIASINAGEDGMVNLPDDAALRAALGQHN